MAKRIFTDESLKTFINEIKTYTDDKVSTKANQSHTHSISDITGLQNALDNKASSNHNHDATNITSGTLSSDRLPTVPISKGGTGSTTAAGVLTNLGITATASELNKLDGVTATTTELNYVDGVTSNIQTQLDGKLSLSGGTITGNLNTTNIIQNGRMFNNLATFNSRDTVDEIVIKTKIPFISGNSMPAINIRGYAYGVSSPIELTVAFYIYNNAFCNMGVTSVCPWNPDIYLSTYTENNTKYVAISLVKEIYFARFVVNMIEIWTTDRDYSKNWSIESKLKTDSTSIIPTTDKVSVPYKPLATSITGNASTATNATYATTAETANSVAWGNVTGKTNATQSASGLMSNTDKTKLDGIATGANKTVVDTAMSSTSTNPVQNKVINSAIDTALTNAKTYTDTKISGLINSAPTTLDTLGEIATAMQENEDVVDALNTAIGTKANSSDLTSHTNNKSNPHGVTLSQLGVTSTATELNVLDGITATTTELNYVDGVTSNIQTQLNSKSASSHTHSNIVTVGDKRSVATTPSNYSNNLIFQGLKTNSTIGSPSGDDYSYLIGLRGWSDKSGGNAHELAFNNSGIFTRNGADTSWGSWNRVYTSANKPTASEIGAAASSHVHATSDITGGTLSSDRLPIVPISKGGTGATTAATVLTNLGINATATELNYVDGVTSNVQTQLNSKAASSHTHNYAGSSSAGGAATSSSLSRVTQDANTLGTSTTGDWKEYSSGSTNIPTTAYYHIFTGNSVDTNYNTQLALGMNANKIYYRNRSAGTWQSWSKIYTSNDKPTLTELGLTATATELNYMDGVTSNVQTQLDGKSNTSHTHSYLPLSGGTLTGRLTGNGKLTLPSTGSSWISGMTLTNHSIQISTQQTTSSYHPYFGVKTSSGHIVNIGGLGDNFGFYGYKSGRTANGTDWGFTFNASTGAVNSVGQITAPTFVGALSGNATTATTATTLSGLTSTVAELNYVDGVTSNIQTQLDGKAASSHNHAAENITSGTLSFDRLPTVPLTKGGTGATTAAAARANLGTLSGVNANGYYGLGLPDGTTSNWIRTTQNGIIPYQSGGSGSLGTSSWPFNNAYINTVYGSLSGNATTATTATSANKLTTARTISLGTGATGTATSFNGSANITIPVTDVKESYLSWGGKNFSGSYGCLDGAMIQDLSANRLSFSKAAGITIEYSRDGGSTWTDYGSSDVAKTSLFTSNGYAHLIGKADSTNRATSSYQLRVTLNATSAGIYTVLNKFCLYVSTNGSSGTTCTIQIAKTSAPTTYTTIVDSQAISGWSGYNIINVGGFTFGSNSDQYNNLRFIFKCTGGSDTYNGLQVMSIQGFGGVGWGTPSNMAKNGHLYSFDGYQNATFPATVTAPTLSGTTFSGSGVATVAEVKSYLGIE